MCLFRSKKDKEQIAILEQKVNDLELTISNLIDNRDTIINYINDLVENIENQNQIIQNLKAIIENHIQNDMDMTEGDKTKWEEN